ncbi:50S ribosomal protein L6 [Aquella oligotrophica]|uniref:Large ribosomal subunit protein uL6 n=1 Tax=Aquella oligotrophica TaxID=2067065 RepID=A0A2I7N8S2_9NEIS|nr:50S ribosomal protein L6 [Aquella oligotrophica]AUR52841.1 50S ribosomal protein L6 [Aquella oligotrophica]
MLSRMAKTPLAIPAGVEVTLDGSNVKVKGPLGSLEYTFNDTVTITKDGTNIVFATKEDSKFAKALSGTVKAVMNNMVTGVTKGFEKKLTILGVGYRAQAQGANLNLTLGFSHPIVFQAPVGIKVETPTQTEILIKGIDKQLVGQAAADIRSYRPVEPYKGKGVRYADEVVILKETKKK